MEYVKHHVTASGNNSLRGFFSSYNVDFDPPSLSLRQNIMKAKAKYVYDLADGATGDAEEDAIRDVMAQSVGNAQLALPDEDAIQAAAAACDAPFRRKVSVGLEEIRERLYEVMWEKVGIIRDGAGLEAARRELAGLETELDASGLADHNRAFNLTWHDWMNLKSLVSVSRAITAAAIARKDSRGAHFRAEHPDSGALETSAFTSIRLEQGEFRIQMKPVAFTRVRPGETLLEHVA